jgi:drug/metabolite transporter (DMT)-like permease
VMYRMVLTAVILFVLLKYNKKWTKVSKRDLLILFGIGSIIAIHWVLFYGSIKKANASIALICLSTAGISTALLQPLFFKTKVKAIELICSLLAIGGLLIIYKWQSDYVLGIVFGVLAATLSSVFTILNKKYTSHLPSQLLAFYEIGTGVFILILLAPMYCSIFPQGDWTISWLDLLWLLCLSYFCTVMGQSLALSALKKLDAFTITLSVNLEPVYGIALAFLFYNENKDLQAGFYYGIILIAISVVLHGWWSKRSLKKIEIQTIE